MSDGKVTALSADSCGSGATVGSSRRVAVSSGVEDAGRGVAGAAVVVGRGAAGTAVAGAVVAGGVAVGAGDAAVAGGVAVGADGVAVSAVRAIANAATAPSKPNETTHRARVLMWTSLLLRVASNAKTQRRADPLCGITPCEA